MKNISWLICVFLLIAMMSVNSFATYSDLDFIGFSKDGKYLAFENTDNGGDAGGGSQTTYIIDTAENSYAIAPIVLEDSDEETAKSKAALRLYTQKLVPAALKKFGIRRGNTGGLVVSHLLSDWSCVTPVEEKRTFYQTDDTTKEEVVQNYKDGLVRRDKSYFEKIIFNPDYDTYRQNTFEFYELTLNSTPLSGEKEGEGATFKMELTLQDKTKHKFIEPLILQKDGDVLPKSRYNPYGYRIESVYVYKDKIAVFINVFHYGFEDVGMHYMVVTGEMYQ
jgi:predicted secreted protein